MLRGAEPAWVFAAGFNRLKRREFLRLFCLQIRHELDPCAPELYSDAEEGGERKGEIKRERMRMCVYKSVYV